MGILDASEPLSTLEHDVYDSEWNHHTEEIEIIANIQPIISMTTIVLAADSI